MAARTLAFPPDLVLEPLSRRPIRLPETTVRAVLGRPVPNGPATRPRSPRASVVVVTFNNLSFTRMCLESLLANTERPAYEVLVVDNGSTDGTVNYLSALASATAVYGSLLIATTLASPAPATKAWRRPKATCSSCSTTTRLLRTAGWMGWRTMPNGPTWA